MPHARPPSRCPDTHGLPPACICPTVSPDAHMHKWPTRVKTYQAAITPVVSHTCTRTTFPSHAHEHADNESAWVRILVHTRPPSLARCDVPLTLNTPSPSPSSPLTLFVSPWHHGWNGRRKRKSIREGGIVDLCKSGPAVVCTFPTPPPFVTARIRARWAATSPVVCRMRTRPSTLASTCTQACMSACICTLAGTRTVPLPPSLRRRTRIPRPPCVVCTLSPTHPRLHMHASARSCLYHPRVPHVGHALARPDPASAHCTRNYVA